MRWQIRLCKANKANINPGTLYALPIASSFNLGFGYYYKNNVGDVIVSFRITNKNTLEVGQDYVVATLPEGFRCKVEEWCGVVTHRSSGAVLPLILTTKSNGDVILYSPAMPGAGTSFYGFMVIPTALVYN